MSARKRGATGLAGVLCIDKPVGPTSHDIVAALRRVTGEGRIGHAGTLDPLASGLLVVLIGPATRLEPFLSAAVKRYDATIAFGSETDTDDAQGEITRTAPVPATLTDDASARAVLAKFLGDSLQMPPAYSAIKVDGKTAHRAARAGEALVLQPRPITVHEAELLNIDADSATWTVRFTVSKGTYIRALARDIGRATDSAAHLVALRRTGSGTLCIAQAVSLEEAVSAAAEGALPHLFTDPTTALGLPVVIAEEAEVADGRPLEPRGDHREEGALVAACSPDGRLLGVYRIERARLVAVAVFPAGIPKGARL